MRLKRIVLGLMTLAGVAFVIVPGAVSARQSRSKNESGSSVPHYQHIVEIMMENTSYGSIIGNSLAPNINALANRYRLATNYFGVTHPSEPNYVANVGGSYFGIQDDNQFYCTPALAATDTNCAGTTVNHTVSAPSLADQLTSAGMTWKGYFQNLPYVDPARW
jgi:phosphatidylinositol-3-phosphatase